MTFGTFLCVLALEVYASLSAGPYVWPLPKTYTISAELDQVISSSFAITAVGSGADSTILTDACTRYSYIAFPHTAESDPPSGGITTLTVNVSSDSEDLQYGADESYTLDFPMTGSTTKGSLTANTIWGAIRGLETFSQLIIYNFTAGYYESYTATISDEPRFSHRGILIDTSRHFQTVDSIKYVLDAMSYAKLNTLHWHIVDSNSFPYQSIAFPKLWNAAYSNYERFSVNDVKEIITHAKDRGIRVVPEFDMPGHASSWCVGYPEICPSTTCTSPLNPAVNATWDLIDGLIKEATTNLFIDDYFHLGGDEVDTACWSSTPSVQAWMTAQGYTPKQALGYFDKKAQGIATNTYNKKVINWVEVFNLFNTTLDPTITTIAVWKAKSALKDVVSMGFHAIIEDNDLWYLDNLKVTWEQMYMNEPFQGITDPTQQSLILGGETCMWGETVDVSDIQQTIWPRAAAVAERLWSPRNINDTNAADPRIHYFRCLLNQRGIAAAPADNTEARSAPPGPGGCYNQRR